MNTDESLHYSFTSHSYYLYFPSHQGVTNRPLQID